MTTLSDLANAIDNKSPRIKAFAVEAAAEVDDLWARVVRLESAAPPAPAPPPPSGGGTPWAGWGFEVSGTKYAASALPGEFRFNSDGTATLTCFPSTATFATQTPPAQLVAISTGAGAQAGPGVTRTYRLKIRVPSDAKFTTGRLNFAWECHTHNGQLSNALGIITDYPVDTTKPGTNPHWLLQANGPAGMRLHTGPPVVLGAEVDLAITIGWATDATGRISIPALGLSDSGANIWAGDTLGMGIYNYRLKPTGTSPWPLALTFTQPVVL